MKEIFIEFMNIFFWVFTMFLILRLPLLKKELKEHQESRNNSIKNGTLKYTHMSTCISLSFYILSIVLTWFN